MQQAAQESQIKQFEEGVKSGTKYSTKQKGNYGEMKMDQNYESLGFERVSNERVTGLDTKGHQGIDAVYRNKTTGEYIVAESKYTTSATVKPSFGNTTDGKQMDINWIKNRLDADVSSNVYKDITSKGYTSELYHIKGNGAVNINRLDSHANVLP